jgi:hypothetical protein
VTSGAGSSHLHAVGTLANSVPSVTDGGHSHTNSFAGVAAVVEPAYVKLAYIMKM